MRWIGGKLEWFEKERIVVSISGKIVVVTRGTVDQPIRELRTRGASSFEAPSPARLRKLYVVSLGRHAATGFTVHRRGGRILPKPSALAIAQIDSDPGYYLLYLDDVGEEMTDTYHDDLNGAFEQAMAEFGVAKEEWQTEK